jgi:hypothetical protein
MVHVDPRIFRAGGAVRLTRPRAADDRHDDRASRIVSTGFAYSGLLEVGHKNIERHEDER